MYSGARNVHHVVTGSLLAGSVGRSVVRVNGDERHQEMLGFGGSPSVPAYQRLSTEGKAQYWQMLKRYNLLIDREYPMGSELKPDLSNLDNLSEATPHYYGDNFPNGEISDFEYSKKALALGGFVVYEMWALPPWATQPFRGIGPDVIDAWGKAVRTAAKPDEYARAMVEYCRRAKERTGTAPAVLGIENEVEQPPEVFDAMVLTLRRELDHAGFTSTRIHMADASFLWMGIGRVKRLQHDPAVWKAIDYTASHEYDFQEFFANPDSFDARLAEMRAASGDKPFLATEICLNDPHLQEPSYRVAFTTGQLYQKNLTILDAASLMYCWLILDVEQPSFGGSRSLLVADRSRGFVPVPSSYELRVLGAFSRHVLRGMHRVGAKSSEADLLVAAFDGAGKSTLVAMNRSTEPQQLQTEWQGKHWSRIERTGPTLENVESSSVPGEVVVEPGEIVVLSTFAAS
jgi:O-glycosyl hydrolase